MKIEWNKVTWYSKAIALALFGIMPFVGFWFGAGYGASHQYAANVSSRVQNVLSSSTTAQNIPAYYENVAEWQTDQNIKNGFSIAYPIDFPTNDNYSVTPISNWRQGTPGGSGLQPFTLTIPKVFEPQTNFDEAVLTVGVSSNNKAVAQCLVAEPSGIPSGDTTSTATINGIPFTVFHLADAGAGNIYETTSYRTIHAGQCWAVEYTIHSSEIGNYPASYGLRSFDVAKLNNVLGRIVSTFKFK